MQDEERNGATSQFAALNSATAKVVPKCSRGDRPMEFKQFPAIINKRVPSEQEIHLELDNLGTHKTAMIHKLLPCRPPLHLHFTSTSTSWLNQVERWFAKITRQAIPRGSFRITKALEQAIKDYFRDYNENPDPLVWTKAADEILESGKSYSLRIFETKHQMLQPTVRLS